MQDIVKFGITLIVAATGAIIGKKYKLPASFLTGAIITVVLCNLISNTMYFPKESRIYVQIASGALVGSRIKRKDLNGMKILIVPGIILMLSMLTMNVIFGLLLYKFTNLDAATAFYGTAPGGMQDMGLISQDFGADPVIVSIIQLVRLVFILTCYPFLYRRANRHFERVHKESKYINSVQEQKYQDKILTKKEEISRLVCTIVLASVGGILFKKIGVPGGALTGSMIFVVIFGTITEKSFFPSSFKAYVQIFAGAYIGAQVKYSFFETVKTLLLPLSLLCIGLIIFTYIVSLVISRTSKLDIISCMLMSTPGGLSEMTLLADEFECDVPKVVVIHTLRVMMVISIFPIILDKIIKLLI